MTPRRGLLIALGVGALAAPLIGIAQQAKKRAISRFSSRRDFSLIINRKAAKQIGLEIPKSMLARADRVIE